MRRFLPVSKDMSRFYGTRRCRQTLVSIIPRRSERGERACHLILLKKSYFKNQEKIYRSSLGTLLIKMNYSQRFSVLERRYCLMTLKTITPGDRYPSPIKKLIPLYLSELC